MKNGFKCWTPYVIATDAFAACVSVTELRNVSRQEHVAEAIAQAKKQDSEGGVYLCIRNAWAAHLRDFEQKHGSFESSIAY
jgi:hypothetical protein